MDIAIRFEGLSKVFGDLTALAPLDMEVIRGEVMGYLGPNGAGKTTTIRLLLGLIKPTSGSSSIFGMDCQRQKVEVHRRAAYIPSEASLWPSLTGEETLHLLGQVHGQIDAAYRDELAERFKFDPSKKVRAYSHGNRQKISIIAALMTRADLLIMDEPTIGLDPLMEQVFRECVQEARSNGQTVFLSSHILAEVEALCDRLAILRSGKLTELGTLAEMRHLSSMKVEATFDGNPPDITGITGVTEVKVWDHQLTCQVRGDVAPLVSALAVAQPKTLVSREPSLEELFLALYGEEGGGREGRDGS
jgi:polyether ionophore transport system ATP-binding protein